MSMERERESETVDGSKLIGRSSLAMLAMAPTMALRFSMASWICLKTSMEDGWTWLKSRRGGTGFWSKM